MEVRVCVVSETLSCISSFLNHTHMFWGTRFVRSLEALMSSYTSGHLQWRPFQNIIVPGHAQISVGSHGLCFTCLVC